MSLPDAIEGALDRGVVRPAILLRLLLDAGAVAIWTGLRDLETLGTTWRGIGDVAQLPELEQMLNGQASRVSLELSGAGVNAPLFAAAVEEAPLVQGREIEILLALFDAADQLIADPQYIDIGIMDQVTFGHRADGDTVERTLTLDWTSPFAARSVAPLSYLTDRDQRARYPTDRGCEYVESYQNREITWNPA